MSEADFELYCTISSGKSAKDEREAKRKAREEKERAEKERKIGRRHRFEWPTTYV
jgi:hypothetical protein